MRIATVPGDTTRPITDRTKESLFNLLGNEIADSRFLDLFGGTGSVGIEALSRGEGWDRLIEGLPGLSLAGEPDAPFDYIYVAPPQYKEMWKTAMQLIDDKPQWMVEDAWVVVQIHPIEYEPITLKHLQVFDERKYGSTLLVFYERLP